jgi:hypothetical protein
MRHLLLLALLPSVALAEVSDKAPSLTYFAVSTPLIAVAAFVAIRWRVGAGVVATLLAAFLASGNYELLTDPQIGPHLVKEQGQQYLWAAYGSALLIYVVLGAAWLTRYLRRRRAA